MNGIDEYDAIDTLLTAVGWEGDFDDEDAMTEAAIEVLSDDFDGLSIQNLTELISILAPLCMVSRSPLNGKLYAGFAANNAFLAKVELKASGE